MGEQHSRFLESHLSATFYGVFHCSVTDQQTRIAESVP